MRSGLSWARHSYSTERLKERRLALADKEEEANDEEDDEGTKEESRQKCLETHAERREKDKNKKRKRDRV